MTNMSTIIRRASCCAIRSLSHKRCQTASYSSLVSSHFPLRKLPQNPPKTPFCLHHFASSVKQVGTDEKLLRALESEIKCAEESDDLEQRSDIPEGFPFEIIDKLGEQTITLKRDFNGETISVEVHLSDFDEEEGEDNNAPAAAADDDNNDENQSSVQPGVSMVVNITKREGPCLEFSCTAYPDDVTIESLFIKNPGASDGDELAYQGPVFSDLDENLQKALYDYLGSRGINGTATAFLHEYMTGKENREYLGWLKNIKEFVEN